MFVSISIPPLARQNKLKLMIADSMMTVSNAAYNVANNISSNVPALRTARNTAPPPIYPPPTPPLPANPANSSTFNPNVAQIIRLQAQLAGLYAS